MQGNAEEGDETKGEKKDRQNGGIKGQRKGERQMQRPPSVPRCCRLVL